MELDYKKMYLSLFNEVSDIITALEKQENAIEKLKQAQQNAEEIGLCDPKDNVVIYEFKNKKTAK